MNRKYKHPPDVRKYWREKQRKYRAKKKTQAKNTHAFMVLLPTELNIALIKKMATHEIGQSVAILDCINESLFAEGFIDRETYEKFHAKYREKS